MPEQATSIDRLLTVLDIVRTYGSDDIVAWLFDGIEQYFHHDMDLETALDLNSHGRGKEKLKTIWGRARRNEWIRKAYNHCDGRCEDAKVEELQRQISRFETVFWPRWHEHDQAPSDSALRIALFNAKKAARLIPSSKSQLKEIISGEMPY